MRSNAFVGMMAVIRVFAVATHHEKAPAVAGAFSVCDPGKEDLVDAAAGGPVGLPTAADGVYLLNVISAMSAMT